jgi:hypothetical protein
MAEGGQAMRFQDIDGIGDKTARKLRRVRGVNNPQDVADYSAEGLAKEAGISESRAAKAIRAGGGNPGYDTSSSSGSVSAGGIAEALDEQKREKAETVFGFGADTVQRGLFAAGQNVERQDAVSSRRKQDQSDITEAPEEDLLRLGRFAESFSEATKDPIDPGESAPVEATEEEQELAVQARLAARRELGGRGYDRDEITDEFAEEPNSATFSGGLLSGFFGAPRDFGGYETDAEEYGRAQQMHADRSVEERRVDNNRRAPVTDEITTWQSDPSHWDYPGVDTPVQGSAFFEER